MTMIGCWEYVVVVDLFPGLGTATISVPKNNDAKNEGHIS